MANASEKIPYLISQPGKGDARRWHWQPGKVLRAAGWRPERLPDGAPTVRVRQGRKVYLAPAEAVARAKKINAQVDAWRRGEAPPVTQAEGARKLKGSYARGQLGHLLQLYEASQRFTDRKPKTQRFYGWIMRVLEQWGGKYPLLSIDGKRIDVLYRAVAKTHPTKAAAIVRFLRVLLKFASFEKLPIVVDLEGKNAARQVIITTEVPPLRIWSDAAITAFVAAADTSDQWHPSGVCWHSVGTAVLLNSWMAQREADIIALDRAAWVPGKGIHIEEQQKTGAEVFLPIAMVAHLNGRVEQELARQADRGLAGTKLLLCESTGSHWKEDYFRQIVRDIRLHAAATAPELRDTEFRHLRHTGITRLKEAGVDIEDIAAISGHSPSGIRELFKRHYLARTTKRAEQAFAKRMGAEGTAATVVPLKEGKG